jgi:hypothetical protein
MNRSHLAPSLTAILAFSLAGCSEAPAPVKKAAVKPPAPVAGLTAIAETFRVARAWSPDVALLHVESGDISEVKSQPGMSGLWRVVFVSPSKSVRREYTYASADSEGGIVQGVRAGDESPYAPSPRSQPIAIQDARTDTVAALSTALEEIGKDKGMKKWLDANPQSPVMFLLERSSAAPEPQWRVIFGASISQSEFSVLVGATTGKFARILR